MIPASTPKGVTVSFPKGRRIRFANGVHERDIENHYYTPAERNDCDGLLTLSMTHRHTVPRMRDVHETWVGKVTFDTFGRARIEQFSRQVDAGCDVPNVYVTQLYTLYGVALHLPGDREPWVLVSNEQRGGASR